MKGDATTVILTFSLSTMTMVSEKKGKNLRWISLAASNEIKSSIDLLWTIVKIDQLVIMKLAFHALKIKFIKNSLKNWNKNLYSFIFFSLHQWCGGCSWGTSVGGPSHCSRWVSCWPLLHTGVPWPQRKPGSGGWVSGGSSVLDSGHQSPHGEHGEHGWEHQTWPVSLL